MKKYIPIFLIFALSLCANYSLAYDGDAILDNVQPEGGGKLIIREVQFDLTLTPVPEEGLMFWNADEGGPQVGMPGGNVNLNVGMEIMLPRRVKNNSGVDIHNGDAVYTTVGFATTAEVALSKADNFLTSLVSGLATEDIDDGAKGWVTTYGIVRGDATEPIDTSAYSAGDFLYLSATTAGEWTDVEPEAPYNSVFIGRVWRSHETEGEIFVLPIATQHIARASDVYGSPSDKDILQWNNSASYFEYINLGRTDSGDPGSSEIGIPEILTATYDDINDWMNGTAFVGKLTGGDFSDDGDGTLTVAAGTGFIKSTNSITGEYFAFDWAEAGVSPADNDITYIGVNYNSGTPVVYSETSKTADGRSKFYLGKVYRNGNSLHFLEGGQNVYELNKLIQQRLNQIHGEFVRASGMVTADEGDLYLNISAGVGFAGLTRDVTASFDSDPGGGADTFSAWYYDGDLGTPAWVEMESQTEIDNANYNDVATGLSALTANRYGVHWVFMSFDGSPNVVYGTGDYTLAQALSATTPADLPDVITEFAIRIAKIIVQEGEAEFYSVNTLFNTSTLGSPVYLHNDLGSMQGGTSGEYYHLTSSQHAGITGITDTYIPYSNSGVFADSPLSTDGTDVTNSGNFTLSTNNTLIALTNSVGAQVPGLYLDSGDDLYIGDTDSDRIYIATDDDIFVTAGSSDTIHLRIGGTDEQTITSTETTFGGNLVIPDDGYIGSASDADAIKIGSDGEIYFTSSLIGTDNGSSNFLMGDVFESSAGLYENIVIGDGIGGVSTGLVYHNIISGEDIGDVITGNFRSNIISGNDIANTATGYLQRSILLGDSIFEDVTGDIDTNIGVGANIARSLTGTPQYNLLLGHTIYNSIQSNVYGNMTVGWHIGGSSTGQAYSNMINGYDVANLAVGSIYRNMINGRLLFTSTTQTVSDNLINGYGIAQSITGNVQRNVINGVNIGNNLTGTMQDNIFLGYNALKDTSNESDAYKIVALGYNTLYQSTASTLDSSIAIGDSAGEDNAYNSPALFGKDSVATENNQMVLGSSFYTGGLVLTSGDDVKTLTDFIVGGDATIQGDLIIQDDGYIGSASDTDAIQIEADGDIVLTQDLSVTGDIAGANLNTSNWDTAYGWGDHSTQNYFDKDTDTLFTLLGLADPDTDKFIIWDDDPGEWAWSDGGGSMVYPGAGIAVSTGAAWDTSISASWLDQDVSDDAVPTFTGLVLDQGGGDDNILEGVSSDVTHPFTSVEDENTYAFLKKESGNDGGLLLAGFSDANTSGLYLLGATGTEAVVDPPIILSGRKSNGSTGYASLAGDEPIVQIRNYGLKRMELFGFGDLWIDGDMYLDNGEAVFVSNNAGDDNCNITLNSSDIFYIGGSAATGGLKITTGLNADINFKDSGTTNITIEGSTGDLKVLQGDIIIPDGHYIGSASDTDAMQIESDGDVVLSQDLFVSSAYSNDLEGDTVRDLQINSSGEIGYDSSKPYGAVPTNLLSNSGFGVWSNSDGPHNYGTAVVEDDCADDDTGDWSVTGDSLTFDTDHYELATSATFKGATLDNLSLTEGHLYKIAVEIKDGTATPTDVYIFYNDGSPSSSSYINITGSYVEYSYIFRADTTTAVGSVGIKVASSLSGANIEFKSFTFYEVTPGVEGANNLAFDTGTKDTSVNIYREPNGSNTKDGSYYALKVDVNASNDWVGWKTAINEVAVANYLGKALTFGAWVKTSTASHVELSYYDGSFNDSGVFHSGGGEYEWMEYTFTLDTDISMFEPMIRFAQSSGDVYISQPMLIFGESIGEGNYQPKQDEWIYCEEASNNLTGFDVDSFSDVSTRTTIDLQALSGGSLPANIKAVLIRLWARDSNVSTGTPYFRIYGLDSSVYITQLNLEDGADDVYKFETHIIPCSMNGEIYYKCAASGTNTLDVIMAVIGVQLG